MGVILVSPCVFSGKVNHITKCTSECMFAAFWHLSVDSLVTSFSPSVIQLSAIAPVQTQTSPTNSNLHPYVLSCLCSAIDTTSYKGTNQRCKSHKTMLCRWIFCHRNSFPTCTALWSGVNDFEWSTNMKGQQLHPGGSYKVNKEITLCCVHDSAVSLCFPLCEASNIVGLCNTHAQITSFLIVLV